MAKSISIFGAAKTKTSSSSAKSDKTVVYIDGLEEKLLEFQFLKAQISDLEAQLNGVTDEVRSIGKEKFIELYRNNKNNPNTFLIKDGEGCVMILPTDKYISIKDEDRANQLMEQYGEDVITVDEKFYFDSEVLQRNMKAIEALIINAKNITNSDKENLLVREVKYSITKGFIDRLNEFDRIDEVVDDVQPIITLKNCGGKMEEGGEMDDDFIANVYEYANGGGVDDINAKREKLIDFYLDNESSYELENFYGVSEDLALDAGTPEGNRIKELRDAVVKYQKLDNNTIVIEKYDIEFNEYAKGGGVKSIFGAAKTKTSSSSAKSDKTVVYIDGLEEKLLEFQFLKAQISDLEAQLNAVTDEVRNIGKEKFIQLYRDNGNNPNTFLIKDGEGCVMILPTDRYISIKDEDRANQLMEQYGEDVITIDEKFYFNSEVLQRNMKAIESLIINAKNITNSDKENLLVREVKYSITKGFIDRLNEFEDTMEEVVDDIQPIITLKNCGGKMEEGGMMGDDFIGNVYEEEKKLNLMKFVVKNLEVQKELENYLAEISNKYFIDYGEQLEEDGYDLDRLFNVSVFADTSTSIPQYVTSFTVPIDDDINFDIDNSIEEKFGDAVELVPYYYKRGGKVDGRSTRAKNTWNRGGAWTRDRNQFNKSQDWEKPMNKRKYAEGGVVTIEEVRENGDFMDSYMIDESQSVSNAGKQESYIYKGKNYLITTWNQNAVEHNDGDEEINELGEVEETIAVEIVQDKAYGIGYYVIRKYDTNNILHDSIEGLNQAYRVADDNGYDVIYAEGYDNDEEYKRGGKVDGRSTRAKNTWNRGGAWTRDRNQFNKSQDWEKPMNKRKYAKGGGIDNEFILSYSKNEDVIYAFRKEGNEDGEGWIPSGRVVRSEDAVKKQVNSLADLAFVADLPMYDGVWTYDPIKNGAEIHFYRHTGYTTSGNLKLEIYYFIVEGDYKSKLESMSDYQLADLYIDDMGNYIDRNDLLIELRDNEAERKDLINKILSVKSIYGIDWLETACYNQNVKNGLREDVETIFQQYDYLNKFIEDKNERIYAKGGKVDGRSTRAKNTWNRGGAWTRDRNQFNKSQDWEVPMNKRKYAEGGGLDKGKKVVYYMEGNYDQNWFNELQKYYLDRGYSKVIAEKIVNTKIRGFNDDAINEYGKGGVPRNVGRDWIFKSKQDWEQKYDRKREYKEYKKEGWLANWFKEGGEAKDLSQYTEAELYDLYGKAEGNWKNDNGAEYERIQAELDKRFLKSQYLPVSTADKYSNFQEMKNLFESNPSKAQKDEFFDRVLKINRNGKTYYATGYNLETRGRTYNLQDSQNALNYYKKNGYDAIIMESPIPTFQFIYDEFEKWQSNPSFIIMTTPALSKSEYKFEHGGETTGDLLDLWQEMGGEKKFQEEKNYDYGSDLTDEAMVKNNLVNGEISADTLKRIVGCELSYPYQIVGAIKLQKCFMRPYYKLS